MAGYQTDVLARYPDAFQAVARRLFSLVQQRVDFARVKEYKGSYSILGTSTKETAAKILIYHPEIGKRPRHWPHMRDGVYVLVRSNGRVARNIWEDILDEELPEMFSRMWRAETIAVAPRHREQFSFFPVMAGDDFDSIANLLAACSRA